MGAAATTVHLHRNSSPLAVRLALSCASPYTSADPGGVCCRVLWREQAPDGDPPLLAAHPRMPVDFGRVITILAAGSILMGHFPGSVVLVVLAGLIAACGAAEPDLSPTAQPNTGDWEMSTSVDEMTDRQRMTIALRSTTYTSSSGGNEAILFIRCSYDGNEHPRWDAFINWDTYLGSEKPPAWQRFGTEDMVPARWDLSTSGQSTFVPRLSSRLENFAFVMKLTQVDRFAARVAKYDQTSITATWDVIGLTTALEPLREHCP